MTDDHRVLMTRPACPHCSSLDVQVAWRGEVPIELLDVVENSDWVTIDNTSLTDESYDLECLECGYRHLVLDDDDDDDDEDDEVASAGSADLKAIGSFGVVTRKTPAELNSELNGVDGRLFSAPLADRQLGWLLLQDVNDAVRNPDGHTVEVRPSLWGGSAEYSMVATAHGLGRFVSRTDLFRVAEACKESEDWMPLFIATYAWGAGRTNVGPTRFEKMLAFGTAEIAASLRTAVDVLQTKGSVAAFSALSLRGLPGLDVPNVRIPGFGPAFFTKFLYFAARPLAVKDDQPLILDRRVADSLRRRTTEILRDRPWVSPEGLAAWAWPVGGWSAHRYQAYLRYAAAATRRMREVSAEWPDRTDPIEVALFTWRDGQP